METSWQRVQAAEAYVLFYCRRHRQPQNRTDLTTSRLVYGPAARPEHSNGQRPSPLATKVTNGHGSSLGVLRPLNNGLVLTTKSGMILWRSALLFDFHSKPLINGSVSSSIVACVVLYRDAHSICIFKSAKSSSSFDERLSFSAAAGPSSLHCSEQYCVSSRADHQVWY
jgi:hypothetical protein